MFSCHELQRDTTIENVLFLCSLTDALPTAPDGANDTATLVWLDLVQNVVQQARSGGGILDDPEPKIGGNGDDDTLPPLEDVLVQLDRVDRDLGDQRLRVEEHRRLDSDDDDDDEKRALKNYIRLMEPAYQNLVRLLRTVIQKVANATVHVHERLDKLESKVQGVAVQVELNLNVSTNHSLLLNECIELAFQDANQPPEPLYSALFSNVKNLIEGKVPANSTLWHPQSFYDLFTSPNVWLPAASWLAGHFFDSQFASFLAGSCLGIRRSWLSKLSL